MTGGAVQTARAAFAAFALAMVLGTAFPAAAQSALERRIRALEQERNELRE